VHEGLTHINPVDTGSVPVLRVDDLGLVRCDLLWFDVEGFELQAVIGAEQTIARGRPVIVVEVNEHLHAYGVTVAALEERIESAGYDQVDAFGSDRVYVPKGRS
jgi:hypothetical protein